MIYFSRALKAPLSTTPVLPSPADTAVTSADNKAGFGLCYYQIRNNLSSAFMVNVAFNISLIEQNYNFVTNKAFNEIFSKNSIGPF